eukprot:25153_1
MSLQLAVGGGACKGGGIARPRPPTEKKDSPLAGAACKGGEARCCLRAFFLCSSVVSVSVAHGACSDTGVAMSSSTLLPPTSLTHSLYQFTIRPSLS